MTPDFIRCCIELIVELIRCRYASHSILRLLTLLTDRKFWRHGVEDTVRRCKIRLGFNHHSDRGTKKASSFRNRPLNVMCIYTYYYNMIYLIYIYTHIYIYPCRILCVLFVLARSGMVQTGRWTKFWSLVAMVWCDGTSFWHFLVPPRSGEVPRIGRFQFLPPRQLLGPLPNKSISWNLKQSMNIATLTSPTCKN